jgi:CTP:molybdopterin cytidylyltransferase MocA
VQPVTSETAKDRSIPTAETKLGAIVLAAGASRRLGFPKQLLTFRGSPLVARAAQAALDAGANPVVVVVGADADLTLPVLMQVSGVISVVNQDWKSGMASSFTTGIRAVVGKSEVDGFIAMLVDQPNVRTSSLRKLIGAFDSDHRLVASRYGNTIGVPAIFGKEFAEELLTLTGDTGAGPWLRANQERVTLVDMPEAELDVDTVNDVEAMRMSDTSQWPE